MEYSMDDGTMEYRVSNIEVPENRRETRDLNLFQAKIIQPIGTMTSHDGDTFLNSSLLLFI